MANITSNPYQGWATITNKLRTLQEIMVFQKVQLDFKSVHIH